MTSNGFYGIKLYEKPLPLKWRSFRERSNCQWIWFRDLRFRTWGLEINHLNAHNFVWQGCFILSLLSRNFDDRSSSNFHRFVILCICWDTPTVKASLWQLPIVSTAFKSNLWLGPLSRSWSRARHNELGVELEIYVPKYMARYVPEIKTTNLYNWKHWFKVWKTNFINYWTSS